MIDTLAMYQKLKASGLKSKQAEAITRAIAFAHTARLHELVDEENAVGRRGLPAKIP
jgi:hypothetical protein